MIFQQSACGDFNDAQADALMPPIRPPKLARPCVLARIKPASVLLLLEPYAEYFTARGTPLDAIATDPDGLSAVMLTVASPCESTPAEMVERLELLDLLCDTGSCADLEDGYEALVAGLHQPDDSAEDIAARIIVHAPQVAWREFDRQALRTKRAFQSYAVPPGTLMAQPDADRIASLERVMRPWFERNRRSGTCHIHVRQTDGSTSFVIRHGDPLRRLSVIAEDGSHDSRILRPERVDVANFRHDTGEWLISGGGRRLQDMYRQAFGLVFHGSAEALTSLHRYSLDPLRRGASSLWCRTGDPIQSAELSFIRVQTPDATRMTLHGRNAFQVMRRLGETYLNESGFLEARIDLQIACRRRLVPVVLRPSGSRPAGMQHDEAVERWLAERGFIARTHETFLLESA
jgi:hypothetical protein